MENFLIIRDFQNFKKGEVWKGVFVQEGERTYIIFDPEGEKHTFLHGTLVQMPFYARLVDDFMK